MLKSVRIIFNTEEIFVQKVLIMPKGQAPNKTYSLLPDTENIIMFKLKKV